MIELHYWPTPNGHKVTLLLEELVELGQPLAYRIVPVDIGKGAQFEPSFLAISPNNKMPAMVDTAPADGGAPVSVFESGAILLYLAEKSGQFLPRDLRGRFEVLQWLFWQVGGLGPMTGQHGHFGVYAPERNAYGIARYTRESERLLGVLDKQLQGRAFIAGEDYSIADMACYPWISPYDKAPLDLQPFANVRRWQAAIQARPATRRAYALGGQVNPDAGKPMSDAEKKILFGQGARQAAP
jgi:GST-like protein